MMDTAIVAGACLYLLAVIAMMALVLASVVDG